MELAIRSAGQRKPQSLLHFLMQYRQPVEGDTGKRMVHTVKRHVPVDPAHKPISPKRSRIPQRVGLMSQARVLTKTLQHVRPAHKEKRPPPKY